MRYRYPPYFTLISLRPDCCSHQVFFQAMSFFFKINTYFFVGEFKQDENFIGSEEKSKENNMQFSINTRLFSARAPSPLYLMKYLEFIRTWLCFCFKKLKRKILAALNSPTEDEGDRLDCLPIYHEKRRMDTLNTCICKNINVKNLRTDI